MARRLPCLALACLAVVACKPAEEDNVYTDATGDPETDSESDSGDPTTGTETDTGSETDTGDTGEPMDEQILRFLASGVEQSVLIALDLDDPDHVPPPDVVEMGVGVGGLFGPTPFGTQALVHDGNVDQISLTETGAWDFEPLADIEPSWIDSMWFGDDGVNALMSVGPTAYGPPNKLYWNLYEEDGTLKGSYDITPPLDDDGVCFVIGRSPDASAAAVLVDAELDGIWQIYVLPLEPELTPAIFIENQDLTGIPAINVPIFLWAHMDDLRVSYRKELLPNMFRPVAIDLENPEATPRNIGPTLPHVYSIVWSEDAEAMVAATEGADDFRILSLVRMDGATDYTYPVTITADGELGMSKLLLPGGPATPGHGFDAMGRIWYAFNSGGTEPTGMMLASVDEIDVVTRRRLGGSEANTTIDDVVFDRTHQILAYRVESATTSWVNYVDLSSDDPRTVRLNANFTFSVNEPDHAPRFGLSADGSTIAAAGIQANLPVVHVAQVGDLTGNTVEIAVPDVERNSGAVLDLQPRLAPNGDQLVLWYRAQMGTAGLIHAPTDGTPAEVVLTLQHPLVDGVFMTPLVN